MTRRKPPEQPAPAAGQGVTPAPPASNPLGDAFVLQNAEGRYWTGLRWSRRPELAERFAEEPDPARMATIKARWLRGLGHTVHVVYLSASAAGLPRDHARRGAGRGEG